MSQLAKVSKASESLTFMLLTSYVRALLLFQMFRCWNGGLWLRLYRWRNSESPNHSSMWFWVLCAVQFQVRLLLEQGRDGGQAQCSPMRGFLSCSSYYQSYGCMYQEHLFSKVQVQRAKCNTFRSQSDLSHRTHTD